MSEGVAHGDVAQRLQRDTHVAVQRAELLPRRATPEPTSSPPARRTSSRRGSSAAACPTVTSPAASVNDIASPLAITLADVQRAAARVAGVAHRTPILRSRTLDERVGGQVALKAEGLQRIGAFKFRGAYNAVHALAEADLPLTGVCAASSGNHAQALALAARLNGTRATILMPHDAPPNKRAATEGYGAEVITFDRYRDDREQLQAQLAAERGLHVVHPYDDPLVMAGAGTTALELLGDAGDLDVLVVPVGGGGLIAGCATVAKSHSAATRVVGVEPMGSDDVTRSKRSGRRERVSVGQTIADGQQLPTPGERTWPIIDALVDDVVTVSDEQIVAAMTYLFERMKVVAEPSGASGLAALLAGAVPVEGQRVGVVLSGANIDAARFAALVSGRPEGG